ncbi:MAG: hypothetical protein ACC657_05515 [Thiohalomonadales bacterium]
MDMLNHSSIISDLTELLLIYTKKNPDFQCFIAISNGKEQITIGRKLDQEYFRAIRNTNELMENCSGTSH